METAFDDLQLTDPLFFATGDIHSFWTHLREHDPVHSTKSRLDRNYWSVTRHADVKFVFENHHLFSSRLTGASLPVSLDAVDPSKSEHARLQQSGAMVVTSDPPRHGKLRAAFEGRFLPAAVKNSEDRVRGLAAQLLDAAIEKGECDFVKDIAGPLPLTIIFDIMDIPKQDWDMLFQFANMHAAPSDPEYSIGTDLETRSHGLAGMMRYCRDLALDRRTHPGNDFLSTLATTEIDGAMLSDDELGFNGQLFVVGGQETTRNSLSGGCYEMSQQSAGVTQLRDNPGYFKTGPDEMLRWASPIAHNMRTATQDVELGGKTIKQGDWVVMWIPSANRDETVFVNPFQFDLGRKRNPHVSFGYGPHFCLGAFLARLELRIMLELLAERIERIEILENPERVRSFQFCGFKTMPVRLHPR